MAYGTENMTTIAAHSTGETVAEAAWAKRRASTVRVPVATLQRILVLCSKKGEQCEEIAAAVEFWLESAGIGYEEPT